MLIPSALVACLLALLLLVWTFELQTNLECVNWLLFTFILPVSVIVFYTRYAILSCNPRLVRSVLPALSVLAALSPITGTTLFMWGVFQNAVALWIGIAVGAYCSFALVFAVLKYKKFFRMYCQDQRLEFDWI